MKIEITHVLLQPMKFGSSNPSKWYEPTDRARELLEQFPGMAFSHLEWPAYGWPGGYELHYYAKDGGVLCHNCANDEIMRTIDPDDEQFYIVGGDVYWEGPAPQCDHCGREIESAYGDPWAEEEAE